MIKNNKVILPDDFYKKYSFTHDFGYSSDTEINQVINILKELKLPYDNKNVLQALEFIKELSLIIDKNYTGNLKEYIKWRENQKFVRGDQPFLISLAKELFIHLIIPIISTAVVSKFLKKDKEMQIINKLVEQMNKDEENKKVIIKIKKTYEIKKE